MSGLLFALAMALSFIEGSLVIPGLLPGMKLGLANIVVMYALFFMGVKQALVLDVLKGTVRFSGVRLHGGVPLAVRRPVVAACHGRAVLCGAGAAHLVHPFGLRCTGPQCGAAAGGRRYHPSSLSLYYAPVMLVLGLVMGALTSITRKALLPALGRLEFSTREKRGE